MGGGNFEDGEQPTSRIYGSPPTDQMALMKHKGISHTRSHLLKELRGLNVTAKEVTARRLEPSNSPAARLLSRRSHPSVDSWRQRATRSRRSRPPATV